MNDVMQLLPEGTIILHRERGWRLLVVAAAHAGRDTMLKLSAYLAMRSPLRVLDGGNRFNAYVVARFLRGMHASNVPAALRNIRVARAFTCYQMSAMLEETTGGAMPTLIIDLLNTFYDESAPFHDRQGLAKRCAAHLRYLAQSAPVIVSLRPPRPPAGDPTGLQQIIEEAADQVWRQAVPPQPLPFNLF